MATDPNSMMFGALALGGMGLVFVALRNVRAEVKTMVLESDDFRVAVTKIVLESQPISEHLEKKSHGWIDLALGADDFRAAVRRVIYEACPDAPKASDYIDLKTRVRHLEAKAKLPETTAIPRSEVHP